VVRLSDQTCKAVLNLAWEEVLNQTEAQVLARLEPALVHLAAQVSVLLE
jgi:hypothetical protein